MTNYGNQQREKARQELVGLLEGVLLNPIRSGEALRAELESIGYIPSKDTQGKGILTDEQSGAVFILSELKPNGLDFQSQVKEVITRTKTADYLASEAGKLATEQAERQVRGQQPHEGRAMLEMQAKDLETIKKHFLDARAGVRPGPVQADGRVQLEIVYQHTQPTIRSINTLLNQAQKWTGVTVKEDSHDREQRQVGATRRGEELKAQAQPEQGPRYGTE